MPHFRSCRAASVVVGMLLALLARDHSYAQQAPVQFGGRYAGLEPRRQQLVQDWVGRFAAVTGQKVAVETFYDETLTLSAKTTFDAVTHALLTTTLTDATGKRLGDALTLVERVDMVEGELSGAPGDRQFRIYVRLTPEARETLSRSREFKRGADNTIFHKGYPTNYRQQGGIPSIQVSIAVDNRQADIDVDYRSSGFPAAMFNGHLSASNSDVRAGNNVERHSGRWSGLENWWRSFFGGRGRTSPDDSAGERPTISRIPRAGKGQIDAMAGDFLRAWLVEGDIAAAMGYVSNRAYACLAQDSDDPASFDRGMAPFQLMLGMKATHDALAPRASLADVAAGVRPPNPDLKIVTQAQHAQFVVFAVPDDVAVTFDCQSQLTLRDDKPVTRAYGKYFGTTFYIRGREDSLLVLLWAKEGDYWKIVSWRAGDGERKIPAAPTPAVAAPAVRVKADESLVLAARAFLDSWLVRKDYDGAFKYLAPDSYACFDLTRAADTPKASSPADAALKIREALERAGTSVGKVRTLDTVLSGVEPIHPLTRVMDHAASGTFALTSIPDALADAAECQAQLRGVELKEPIPVVYGNAAGMNIRFRTQDGEAPVLRLLWRKQNDAWRITSYDVEVP